MNQLLQAIQDLTEQIRLADKDALSLTEISKWMGKTPNRIRQMVREGSIPHYKQGNLLYFSKREVEAWLLKDKVATREELRAKAHNYLNNKRQ